MYNNLTDPRSKNDVEKSAQQLRQEEANEKAANQNTEDLDEVSTATNVDKAIVNEESIPPPSDEPLNIVEAAGEPVTPDETEEVIPDQEANKIVNGEDDETQIF